MASKKNHSVPSPAPEPFPSASSSLPVLVRMPDGERRQVNIPPNATVKDLKTSIANYSSSWGFQDGEQSDQPWDLDFGGSILNDNQTLGHYNIPDTYDHANNFLKTISDGGYADADKKIEALDKACAVVQHISRGEKDMERLISSVFDDVNEAIPDSPSAQPHLRSLKRPRPSRIPPLDFANLPPPVLKSGKPSAPPTPSQLMRKLSGVRPDLYDPTVARRTADSPSIVAGANSELPNSANAQGSGDLKRGETWFSGFISSVLNSSKPGFGSEEDDKDDVDGLSEGGAEPQSTVPEPEKPAATPANANPSPVVNKQPSLQSATGDPSAMASQKSANKTDSNPNPSSGEGDKNIDVSTGVSEASVVTNGNLPNASDKKDTPAAGSTAAKPINSPANTEKQVIGLAPDSETVEEPKVAPKKRGRKRKNPHLSEEERKAQRQAQNRESAKLSRIRKKNMTIEYERRVSTLEGENENLRGTVAALNDRLEMLQNLLTISVQKRALPMNAQSRPMLAGLPHLGAQPNLSAGTPLGNQPGLGAPGLSVTAGLGAPGTLPTHAALGAQAAFGGVPNRLPLHGQLNSSHPGQPPVGPRMPDPRVTTTNPLANLGYKNY